VQQNIKKKFMFLSSRLPMKHRCRKGHERECRHRLLDNCWKLDSTRRTVDFASASAVSHHMHHSTRLVKTQTVRILRP